MNKKNKTCKDVNFNELSKKTINEAPELKQIPISKPDNSFAAMTVPNVNQFLAETQSLQSATKLPTVVTNNRAPQVDDVRYNLMTFWVDTSVQPYGIYVLTNLYNYNDIPQANWLQVKQTIASDLYLGTFLFQNIVGQISKSPINGAFRFIAGDNVSFSGTINNGEIIITVPKIGDTVEFILPDSNTIKYTNTEKYISFENGTGISIEKGSQENSVKITANTNIQFDEFVKTITTDNGTATAVNSNIIIKGTDGLETTVSLNEILIEIQNGFSLIRTYIVNETYTQGELVLYNNLSYVCVQSGIGTSTTPDPNLFRLNQPIFQINDTLSGSVVADNGVIELATSDSNVLNIEAIGSTNPKSVLEFQINAIKTLKDTSDVEVIKDIDSCIKFTARSGSFVARAGELYLDNPLPPGVNAMDGLLDQNDVSTTLDSNYKVKLLPAEAIYDPSDLTSDLKTEVGTTPIPSSTMLFKLVNPLKYIGTIISGTTSFVGANANKQIMLASPTNTINISVSKATNTINLDAILNNAWIKILLDDVGSPAIPLLPNGDVQLTSNTGLTSNDRQISITRDPLNPYRMIFRLLITWVQGIVAGDNNVVTPNPSNRNITILGVDPSVDNVYITTYRDTTNPSILRLKVNGIAPINSAVNNTGAVGTINYTYNNTTRTVTINSGKFNFLQSNGTALQTSITTPISFTNNTVGTSYLWIDNTGSFYNSVTLTDSDFRLFCYIGALYYDNIVPANSFFFFQPDNFQTSALNIDIALGLGPIILNNSGYGIGEGLNGSKVILNPLIARMNTTGGRLLYPSINSSNSQYFANNKLLVSNGSSPTTIKFYYYSPTSGAFVLFNTGVDLILSQYAPNGVITAIPNNNNAYMNVYFVRDKSLDPALSYWVCVLGNSLASNQFDALQLALQQHNTRPFTLSRLLPQFVSYRSRIVWRKTQTDYTSALYINNNDAFGQASLSTSGSGGGGGDDKVYITKKGVVGDILARTTLLNNNLTIVIAEGETYIDGVLCPQGIINYTLTPTAETRKYIISSDASGVGHIDQLTSNFDFYTFYLTRAPLVLLWLDSTNRIHNLTGYSNQKVELSTELVNLFKMDAYKTSCVGTVVQPTSASLVTATITNIKAVHTVFNDIFTPWQQANIDRLLFNSLTNTITEYPLLPSDTLWRASILFVTNCAEKTPVVYSATRYGNDEIDFSRIVIKDGKLHVLNKDKKIVLTNPNPYVFGRNTGYYYEIFLTTQGFDNAGDCKQNLTQLLNQYYGFFFESMALKVCFYQGTTLSDVIDVNLNGRAVGSNRCIVTDDNKSSITF